MTSPMSQSGVPAAAAAAAEGTRDEEEGAVDTARDSDGVPVGQADLEADVRRAEEDNDSDK